MELSKLYVCNDGFLMCGEPGRSTAMVEGLRLVPLFINKGRNFDYDVLFINDLGWFCQGYSKKCKEPFRMNLYQLKYG